MELILVVGLSTGYIPQETKNDGQYRVICTLKKGYSTNKLLHLTQQEEYLQVITGSIHHPLPVIEYETMLYIILQFVDLDHKRVQKCSSMNHIFELILHFYMNILYAMKIKLPSTLEDNLQ